MSISDRIIALICLIPAFFLGANLSVEIFTKENPEFKTWNKKYSLRKLELENEFKNLSESELKIFRKQFEEYIDEEYRSKPVMASMTKRLGIQWHYVQNHMQDFPKEPPKMIKPQPIKILSGGLIFALLASTILLFMLKGLIRGVKWLVDGFED